MEYFSRILYIITGRKNRLLLMVLIFISVSLLDTVGIGLVGPFMGLATSPNLVKQNALLNQIYTQIGFKSSNHFIALIGLVIVLVFYLKSFLNFKMQEYVFKFSLGESGKLVERLLKSYLSIDYTFHLQRNTSTIIQTLITETASFSSNILIPLLISVSNIAVLGFLLVLLAYTSLTATVGILGVILLAFLISNLFRSRMSRWGQEGSHAQAAVIRIINHSLGGIKETRVFGCESYFEQQISIEARRYASSISSILVFGNLPRILIEVFLITFLIGFTSISITTGQEPQKLVSVLSVFAIASIRMLPAASALLGGISTVRTYKYVADKLYLDLKEVEKVKASDSLPNRSGTHPGLLPENRDHEPMTFSGHIALKQVTYNYPNVEKPSIQDLSLRLNKGQAIALIGKSGAGKTTLVDIILGLLKPQSGDIEVDGVSIYKNLRQWQDLIGYIPQSIFLMDDTVEHNIAFGVSDDQIDPERLRKAIRAAQLSELVEELPEGIKTIMGERGVRLSGGQRQRIGIARALYHEREILVLDEATAALDNETERLVNDAIKALSGQKTLIIIAHRLTTVEHCDRIYLMERGEIIKEGSYKEIVLGESTAGASQYYIE